jgi:hypothetical protein
MRVMLTALGGVLGATLAGAAHADELDIRITNVSLVTDPSPQLARAVREVRKADAGLVVALLLRPVLARRGG